MKTFSEWKRDKHTKTITITCRDQDDTLEDMLNYIKSVGNSGHTFDIVLDNGEKKFSWDGDGSDAVFEIDVKKEAEKESGLKLAFNIEGEPEEIGESHDRSSRQKAMTELITLLKKFFKDHSLVVRKAIWEKIVTGKGKKDLDRLLQHPKEVPLNIFQALVND